METENIRFRIWTLDCGRYVVRRSDASVECRYCGWSLTARMSLDTGRRWLAEHLNGCERFGWPTLPYGIGMDIEHHPSYRKLNGGDVGPSRDDGSNALILGVTTAAFGVHDRVEIPPLESPEQLLATLFGEEKC